MSRLLIVLMLLASFFAACAEPVTASPRKKTKPRTTETQSADLNDGDEDEDDTTESKTTPAENETEDEPVKAPPPPPPAVDSFGGAPAFAGNAPAKDSTDHHLGNSNAGKECMSCHATGKGAPTFAFGGTVQASKTNTTGVSGVEVRVVDDKGTQIALVTTDSAGNFWFPGATAIPGGSKVGIRTADGVRKMSGAIATGACNSSGCHSKNQPIFLAN